MNRRFLVTGALAFAFLTAYFFDRGFTPNPGSRFLPVVSVVRDGTLYFDRFADLTQDKAKIGTHYFSDKAPFSTFLVIPFDYVITRLLPPASDVAHLYLAYSLGILLCGVFPFLFLAAALFAKLGIRRRSRHAVWLSTLPILASPLSIYCGTFYGHLLAGALTLASWLCAKSSKDGTATRAPLASGALAGLAVLSEYQSAILVLGIAAALAWRTRSPKSVALFALGCLPAFVALLVYNDAITGLPFQMTYSFVDDPEFSYMKSAYGFGLPSLRAMTALSIGPARGALVYAPALIALAWATRKRLRAWVHPLAFATIAFFLCISAYKMYWGGWAYGPRHLIPALFLIFYEGILLFDEKREPFWPLAVVSGWGLVSAWLANATVTYMIPEYFFFPPLSVFAVKAREGNFNAGNLPTLIARVSPAIACLAWLPLTLICLFVFDSWYRRPRSA